MNETVFAVILIVIEVIFSTMILKALRNAGAKKCMLIIMSLLFGAWLVTDYLLIKNGFFSATGMPQIAFTAAVVIPVIIGFLSTLLYQPLNQVVSVLSTETFLRLQLMRSVFGILFFFTAALPFWFQLVGGLGDIAAGIGALIALLRFKKHPDQEYQAIIGGNLVGILDFIVVINLGVLVVLKSQSPDIVFDLIPLYVVPLFILFHIFSLLRLKTLKDANNGKGGLA